MEIVESKKPIRVPDSIDVHANYVPGCGCH